MTQQELNLFKFTTADVTQFRACPPQVKGSNVVESCPLPAIPDYVPHDILGKYLF